MKARTPLPLLLLTLTMVPPAVADTVELAGSLANGGIVVSQTIATGAPLYTGVFWNATGIHVGNDLFLYVQGTSGFGTGSAIDVPYENCTDDGDKILLFRAPWTPSGVTGPFQFVKRIHPCTVGPAHLQPNPYWAPGQVFDDGVGNYRMVAERSDGTNFPLLLLGTSQDGQMWSWEGFVSTNPSHLRIFAPILTADPLANCFCNPSCFCHHYWWGFFPFDDVTIQGTGVRTGTGRMQVDVSPEYPRGFRVTILDQSGVWRAVDDVTGYFDFKPMNVWPDVSVRSLILNNGAWELWAWRAVPHNGCAPCSPGYSNGAQGTTIVYRNVTKTSLSPVQSLFSLIRCMPSDSDVGRTFPLRINGPNGMKLLYSGTNDANICRTDLFGNFQGSYLVVTEVQN